MKSSTLPAVESVARAFSNIISQWLTPSELREVVTKNTTPEYKGMCATHDFCDPNQAMLNAFTECGHDCSDEGEADLQADDFLCVWNEARTLAKRAEFNAASIPVKVKYFKAVTTVGKSEFVDWFEGETENEVRQAWEIEARKNGVPLEKATVTFAEVNRETLAPV